MALGVWTWGRGFGAGKMLACSLLTILEGAVQEQILSDFVK